LVGDGVIDLMESGVINGERKTLHRGKAVISIALGSQRLIDFVHDNPAFEFRPIATPTIRLWWRRTTGWSPSTQHCRWI